MDPYLNTIEFGVLARGNGWAFAKVVFGPYTSWQSYGPVYSPKPTKTYQWRWEYSICPVLPTNHHKEQVRW